MKPSAAFAAALAAVTLATGAGSALAQSPANQMTGRHSMQGTVTSVDAKKGWIHVKTDEGTVIAYFPPANLQSIKKGDMVTLELAMKDNGAANPKKP
jgi:hypothetical protein